MRRKACPAQEHGPFSHARCILESREAPNGVSVDAIVKHLHAHVISARSR